MTSKTTNKFSAEVRERAVRLVQEHAQEYPSRWQAIVSISSKIGCSAHSLNEWLRKAEVDAGKRAGVTSDMSARLKALERENRELRQANEILVRRRHISLWRSSTAGRRHDRVHRRSSCGVWGRADLQGPADRPVDVSCACRPTARCVAAIGASKTRRGLAARGGSGVRRELRGLWSAQGLATDDA